jgi:hypothetical protein
MIRVAAYMQFGDPDKNNNKVSIVDTSRVRNVLETLKRTMIAAGQQDDKSCVLVDESLLQQNNRVLVYLRELVQYVIVLSYLTYLLTHSPIYSLIHINTYTHTHTDTEKY